VVAEAFGIISVEEPLNNHFYIDLLIFSPVRIVLYFGYLVTLRKRVVNIMALTTTLSLNVLMSDRVNKQEVICP
jgi:hypothetical protein